MKGSRAVQGRENRIFTLSITRPILMVLGLFLVAVMIKVLDTFILRLDEQLGEAILTKSLGFALVVAYVWACGQSLRAIGFRQKRVKDALLIAGVSVIGLFVVSYGTQLIALIAGGQEAGLLLTAVDPKSGMSGGVLFGLWMILSNLVNSAMEEGLFRGVMLRHFRIRFSAWGALLLQAFLFSIWHLNWPLKNWLWFDATAAETGFEAFSLLLATFISGLLYGYLYLKTNNLWGPFLAHTINNTVLNMVFISTAESAQNATQYPIFLAVWLPGHLLLLFLFRWWSKRLQAPEVTAWGSDSDFRLPKGESPNHAISE